MEAAIKKRFYASYVLPAITMAWMQAPIVVVQGVYAKYMGLSLTSIAAVVLFARIFDAVSDPLIGYYADRYIHRHATRKPLVLVDGLLMILSAYFLYVPLVGGIAYFALCLFAFYLAYTIFEVPHQAWASDMAQSSTEKTVIFSLRNMAVYFGLSLFYIVPLLPLFETKEITPETLEISVLAAGITMLVFLIICVRATPNGTSLPSTSVNHPIDLNPGRKILTEIRRLLHSLSSNRPLCIFLAGYIFYGFGMGMWLGMLFLFVDSYLGAGELFAQTYLVGLVVSIAVTPLWCKLAIRLGKKTTMALGMLMMIISFIYTAMLSPGDVGLLEMLILNIVNTTGAGCIAAIAPAMLSKVCDYSTWKFGSVNTATYFALYLFFTKFSVAVGGAIGLAIAGWYGFDATVKTQSEEGVIGLLLVMSWLPTLLLAVALLLTGLNPINAHRHNVIRKCLAKRSGLVKVI